MKAHSFIAIFCLYLLAGTVAFGQPSASVPLTDQSLMVLPFQNPAGSAKLEWVREAFPEVIGQRILSPSLYVVSRDERFAAFDRFGVPANIVPSRATVYRLAEQMDLDFVVLGHFEMDGDRITVTAQLLDVHQRRLSPDVQEWGSLNKLVDIQNALAWDMLRQMRPDLAESREAFLAASHPMRLDALEHYMRGVTATTTAERVSQLQETLKITPDYVPAMMQLGKNYLKAKKYDDAIVWLSKVPVESDLAREANFLVGLAAYSAGEFDKAETAFNFLAARFPLTEVYNNLGVVAARRGRKTAGEFFQRAVQADPADADYRFNFGVALYRAGDSQGAAKQLREAITLSRGDAEAKALLEGIQALSAPKPAADSIAAAAVASGAATLPVAASGVVPGATATAAPTASALKSAVPVLKIPAERLKRNYDGNSYRQLALQLQIANEMRMASSDPLVHARFHTESGHEFLAKGFLNEADHEFREALQLDPSNADAHAGAAQVRELNGDAAGARVEAEAALRIRSFVAPLLVLARLSLRENKLDEAAGAMQRALVLDPANQAALALQKQIASKMPKAATADPR